MRTLQQQYKQNRSIYVSHASGFTLVETLVAIFILMLVIVGPMGTASRGLQSAYFANERTTAVFLAQEAIEDFIRLRNDNALEVINSGGNTWDWYTNDVPAQCKGGNVCDLNINNGSGTFVACPAEGCRLEVNSSPVGAERVYGYGGAGWSPSTYKRGIRVTEEIAGTAASVEVWVTWDTNLVSSNNTVTLQTWIYNAYNDF